MKAELVISIIGTVISILGFLFVWIKGVIETRERLTRVEVKVDVFWKDVAFDAARILHTPHPENARRDYLIEQLLSQNITRSELEELVETLKKIIDEKNRVFGERMAASLLLRVLQKQYEI